MDDARYPIGRFQPVNRLTLAERRQMIDIIAAAPSHLRDAVRGLKDAQLDTPYREGGWTLRQVVHHLPDSHVNAYTRLKLALTEEEPAIKPYDEGRWAELPDARQSPVEVSLALLESLHVRWVTLLRSLGEGDYDRAFRHPEHGLVNLHWLLAMYGWHSRHHVAHITSLRQRMGW